MNIVVGVRGLEPPTSRSQTARASQLRHTPTVCKTVISIASLLLFLKRSIETPLFCYTLKHE